MPRAKTNPIERFWAQVSKAGSDDCWLWLGGKLSPPNLPYGLFWDGVKTVRAHRYGLELKLGRRLVGLECSLHKCDNPRCVNPLHLFVGTKALNNHDKVRKGRHWCGPRLSRAIKAKCPRGVDQHLAKATPQIVAAMRRLYTAGKATRVELSRKFKLHWSTVDSIVNYETWTHV